MAAPDHNRTHPKLEARSYPKAESEFFRQRQTTLVASLEGALGVWAMGSRTQDNASAVPSPADEVQEHRGSPTGF